MNLQSNIQNEKLLFQKYGMGLHIVLELAQKINIKIVFEPNSPRGTVLKIFFIK